MPTPPIITQSPARSMLINGLMQTDLDADFHKILNLDMSNLVVGGPGGQPHVAHNWIDSFDSGTLLFHISQPATVDLADFPLQTGQAGKVLSTNGSVLAWVPQTSGGIAGNGFINVKDPPYNAVGDGVTDDYAVIQQAVTDAGGRTVYFPKGTYYVSSPVLLPQGVPSSIIGDGSKSSVLLANPGNIGVALGVLGFHSTIDNMGFDGNLANYVQNAQLSVGVLAVLGAGCCIITRCRISNSTGVGLLVGAAENAVLENIEIENCPAHGIWMQDAPRGRLSVVKVMTVSGDGIHMTNSPYSNVEQCHVAGAALWGIHTRDSEYTIIDANNVTRNTGGILCEFSPGRTLVACGHTVTGTNVFRNYLYGIRFSLTSAFQCSGNTFVHNGQGGNDGATYTIEPGIIVHPSFGGSGYQAGDILTLSGGAGTPAKILVWQVGSGGGLFPDSVHPISMGNYTTFPNEFSTATGGHGTGAQFIYSGSKILSAGTGYVPGESLKSTNGTTNNPVRVLINEVSGSGAVSRYEILDGGGFTGTLPTSLVFISESLAEGASSGSGFTITPRWARRYSIIASATELAAISTLGALIGGQISSNMIAGNFTGTGILIEEDVAPFNGRAVGIWGAGNTIGGNLNSIRGHTIGNPVDTDLGTGSVFSPNLIAPAGT